MTDQKSADGKRFTTGALFDAIYQGSLESTPTCLTHDSHRMIGWSRAEGLYVAPDMDSVTGNSYIAENEEDLQRVSEFRKIWINNQVVVPFNKYGKEFQKLLLDMNLIDKNKVGYLHYCSMLMFGYKGIVARAFPGLESLKNKYKQIKLTDIEKDFDYLGAGVFKNRKCNLAIMLHPYLRKSLSRLNNFNLEFLEAFFAYKDSRDVELEVTIDDDFVGYAPSFLMPSEFEHIYGAPFDDDVSKVKLGPVCYENTFEDHQYYQSLRTEYNWKWEGGEFTFEMEDVNDYCMPGALNKEYGCYYVHSQYDFNNGVFKHFDGAIREYDEEEMLERIDCKLTNTGKDKKYTKIFRMDGKIPIQEWKRLIMKFTYGIPSVYEYFGQQKPVIPIGEQEPKPSIYNYVPYKLNEGDGVRLYVTFEAAQAGNNGKRWIDTCDVATTKDGVAHHVIETKAYELIHYISKNGAAIADKDGCESVDAKDNYVNVPVIAHGDENSLQTDVNNTWKGIYSYLQLVAEDAPYMTYTFTIAWNMSGRMIQFCVAGNIVDLCKWIRGSQMIPVEYEGFRKWLEHQSKDIHQKWQGVKSFEREELINGDGILYFKRRNITEDIDLKDLKFKDDGTVSIDSDIPELKEMVEKGIIFISPTILDGEWVCCNWSTSKVEDNG